MKGVIIAAVLVVLVGGVWNANENRKAYTRLVGSWEPLELVEADAEYLQEIEMKTLSFESHRLDRSGEDDQMIGFSKKVMGLKPGVAGDFQVLNYEPSGFGFLYLFEDKRNSAFLIMRSMHRNLIYGDEVHFERKGDEVVRLIYPANETGAFIVIKNADGEPNESQTTLYLTPDQNREPASIDDVI